MVFHTSHMVVRENHEILSGYIELTDTIEDDMAMNITSAIVAIPMCANYCLVSGKASLGKLHAKLLRPLGGESIIITIIRIKAHNIVMSLNLSERVVLTELLIYILALYVEIVWITVDSF